MVCTRQWARWAAGHVPLAGLLTAAAVGCQATATDAVAVSLTQTPPTVQAAYNEDHPGTVIRSVTQDTRGGQHYYTVKFQDADGSRHDVVYNGAGDQIDKH